jgi:hypothetical protein
VASLGEANTGSGVPSETCGHGFGPAGANAPGKGANGSRGICAAPAAAQGGVEPSVSRLFLFVVFIPPVVECVSEVVTSNWRAATAGSITH